MLENEAFADGVNPQKNKYIMFSAEKKCKASIAVPCCYYGVSHD